MSVHLASFELSHNTFRHHHDAYLAGLAADDSDALYRKQSDYNNKVSAEDAFRDALDDLKWYRQERRKLKASKAA